jgi:hypothetical protein
LKRHIAAVIGTRTTDEDDVTRQWLLCDYLVRRYGPTWLRLGGLGDTADGLAELPPLDSATVYRARPRLRAAQLAAVWRTPVTGFSIEGVQTIAKETGWDAAAAALAPWDAPLNRDFELILDMSLSAIGTASRADFGPSVDEMRDATHAVVAEMCEVGRRPFDGASR